MNDLRLAKLSCASYNGIKDIKKLGFNRVVKFRSGATGTKAYLAVDDTRKEAVIVFRGTERDGKDILTDISFFKKHYRGGRVHKGFLVAYLSVQKHIDKEMDKLPDNYTVYTTGHSLGGSLACLQAMYGSVQAEQIITFGQPRVGNKNVAHKLSRLKYRRYVNHADLVTRVPKINYWHEGELIYFTKKENTLVNPSWWTMFKDRAWYVAHRFVDHKCCDYVRILEKQK